MVYLLNPGILSSQLVLLAQKSSHQILSKQTESAKLPTESMASTSTSSISLQTNTPRTSSPSSPATKPFHNNPKFSFPLSLTKVTPIKSSSTTRYNEVVIDEEMDKIRRLQNGSDVRGVALEGEKGRTVDLTPPALEAIAESFGEWVINGLEKERGRLADKDVRVSLGRDPRVSGASLSVAVLAGLSRAGCLAFDMGLATTPACFMSTLLPPFAYDASIMVVWNSKLSLGINILCGYNVCKGHAKQIKDII